MTVIITINYLSASNNDHCPVNIATAVIRRVYRNNIREAGDTENTD
jgi:hypothetical protein